MKGIFLLCIFSFTSYLSFAQGYVDQKGMYPISESMKGDIAYVQKVNWQVYHYDGQLEHLIQYIDSLPGAMTGSRRLLLELANRVTAEHMKAGRILFVPDTFQPDYRAYAPYPFQYDIAISMPKLFVIDKYTQTFAAYEYGRLVHWGIVSTGRKNDLTPAGRYNFNWKTEYRKSTAAPPGEVWEMYWVFDFHAKFGIHIHQYSLPIGAAVSHGCVRTSEPDAIWNYNWANGWVHDNKNKLVRNGTPIIVINNNPNGRPAQWKFVNNEIISQVHLPASFDELKLGTVAQKQAAWNSGW